MLLVGHSYGGCSENSCPVGYRDCLFLTALSTLDASPKHRANGHLQALPRTRHSRRIYIRQENRAAAGSAWNPVIVEIDVGGPRARASLSTRLRCALGNVAKQFLAFRVGVIQGRDLGGGATDAQADRDRSEVTPIAAEKV